MSLRTVLSLLLAAAVVPATRAAEVPLPAHPTISPDGQTIVFAWAGDLWTVPAEGGAARRLTNHPADDRLPRFSHDGETIAFTSNRAGVSGLFTMTPEGTNVRERLLLDRASLMYDFGDDGQLYFTGYLEPDVYRNPRPYVVGAESGVPERVHDAFGRSPAKEIGGDRVLFVRGNERLTRRHSRGPDTRDIWLYDPNADEQFTQLTERRGNDARPMWLPDGLFLFTSDRNDRTVNLFVGNANTGRIEALTSFTDADVDEFDVTPDGRRVVFAKWDTLYTLDLEGDGEPVPVEITASQDAAAAKLVDVGGEATDVALSPDGKTVASVSYGQVYVRGTDDNAVARRVSELPGRHSDVAWSPDGGTLYFTRMLGDTMHVMAATVRRSRADVLETKAATTRPALAERPAPDPEKWPTALAFHVEAVTEGDVSYRDPTPSLDGRRLALHKGLGDLVVLNLRSGRETLVYDGWDADLNYAWAPDGQWLVVRTEDADFNSDVWAMKVDGTRQVNLTRHPDNDYSFSLSADGRVLTFSSERIAEEFDVWQVYLDEELEALAPAELQAYYDESILGHPIPEVPAFAERRGTVSPLVADPTPEQPTTQPAKLDFKKLGEALSKLGDNILGDLASSLPSEEVAPFDELELDTAYLRLRRLTRESGNEFAVTMVPDATAIFYISNGRLMRQPWDGGSDDIGSSAGFGNFTADGDTLALLASGRPGSISQSGRSRETYTISDRLAVNVADEQEQKFRELAATLGMLFYHPTMKGLDWPALTDRYAQLARLTRTGDEFETVGNKLLGELNASHLGVTAPGTFNPTARRFGQLGVRTDVVDDGFEVTDVLATGPAGVGDFKLEIGDIISAIEFEPVDTGLPLPQQLVDRVGRETVVTVQRDGGAVDLLLTPVSYGQLTSLTYDAWRLDNAGKVEELSGGRLGYIHVRGMNQASLDVFERDLYAAAAGKDGLVIDVRNNGGGWTTDRLLASIMYPRHAYTIPRGMRDSVESDRVGMDKGGYPQDRLFIQRYDLPINMLANEKSFSNAEIISHAFKNLGRGTLVGQETAGGVISTGSFRLVDGTRVRLPFRGWYLPDGSDMENNGAVPDLLVPQTPEAEAAGRDEQLEAAVTDLLQRLDATEAEARR
ncbi:MAG: S41 family peptidase [Planctomycetota bacterium]